MSDGMMQEDGFLYIWYPGSGDEEESDDEE
jgi:hypothetical protein